MSHESIKLVLGKGRLGPSQAQVKWAHVRWNLKANEFDWIAKGVSGVEDLQSLRGEIRKLKAELHHSLTIFYHFSFFFFSFLASELTLRYNFIYSCKWTQTKIMHT